MSKRIFIVIICFVFSLQLVSAEEIDIEIVPYGYGALEVGQVVKGVNREEGADATIIDHVWQERVIADLGLKASINERLTINIAGTGLLAFSFPQVNQAPVTMFPRKYFSIKRAYAQYEIGDLDAPFMRVQLGYFPYKYNDDVRNLGEYMFRSSLYPVVLYTDFNFPMAEFLGLRIANEISLGEDLIKIKNDLMLHSELYGIPVQDWSISDIASVNVIDFVEIGGGISFNRLFSVYQGDNYRETWADNFYNNVEDVDQKNYFAYETIGYDTSFNTFGDTIIDTLYSYIKWNDIKLMARLSFDFKRFIPVDIFGESDLRLYGEVDLLGLTNYDKANSKNDYKYIEDRVISTFGFNFPGFKIIDVINMEWEFSSNPFAYSYGGYVGPVPNRFPTINEKFPRHPWKWSVYLKKTFFDEHFGIVTQFARDHKKINFHYFEKQFMDYSENLSGADNWWWAVRAEFNF